MGELRWVEGPVGCADLVAADGTIWGWVEPVSAGVRGVVVNLVFRSRAQMADHAEELTARAWVEIKAGRTSRSPPTDDTRERS